MGTVFEVSFPYREGHQQNFVVKVGFGGFNILINGSGNYCEAGEIYFVERVYKEIVDTRGRRLACLLIAGSILF